MSYLHYSDTSVVQGYSQFDILLSLLDSSLCTFFFFSCSNQVLVITRFWLLQNSSNLSPLSFVFPNPNIPITLSSLPSPTTALKSPITIKLSVPFCLPNISSLTFSNFPIAFIVRTFYVPTLISCFSFILRLLLRTPSAFLSNPVQLP